MAHAEARCNTARLRIRTPTATFDVGRRLGDHQGTAVELPDIAAFRSRAAEFLVRNRV